MRSLRDTNVAKIEGDDLKIFMGLLLDLFPGATSAFSKSVPSKASLAALEASET